MKENEPEREGVRREGEVGENIIREALQYFLESMRKKWKNSIPAKGIRNVIGPYD